MASFACIFLFFQCFWVVLVCSTHCRWCVPVLAFVSILWGIPESPGYNTHKAGDYWDVLHPEGENDLQLVLATILVLGPVLWSWWSVSSSGPWSYNGSISPVCAWKSLEDPWIFGIVCHFELVKVCTCDTVNIPCCCHHPHGPDDCSLCGRLSHAFWLSTFVLLNQLAPSFTFALWHSSTFPTWKFSSFTHCWSRRIAGIEL